MNLDKILRADAGPLFASDPAPAVLTVESVRAAMEALRDAPYRVCQHVVRPAPAGLRWEIVDDVGGEILRCGNLCGWAAFARAVPA